MRGSEPRGLLYYFGKLGVLLSGHLYVLRRVCLVRVLQFEQLQRFVHVDQRRWPRRVLQAKLGPRPEAGVPASLVTRVRRHPLV